MSACRRIVYAGTPEFAVPALQTLIAAGRKPVAVYTQPDRPAGRGRKLTASPVKCAALEASIQVLQPETLRSAAAQAELKDLAPDLLVVAAYGLILPPAVLAVPACACVNIHASLLPRWRGAAPIQRAILAGDRETGVCLMRMEAGLDTGPVYDCARFPLDENATAASVHDRLARMGADLLLERLDAIVDGRLQPLPQPTEGVTYAAKIGKEESWIDWNESADAIDRRVRAFNPWPVAQTACGGRILRIHRSRPVQAVGSDLTARPGTVLGVRDDGVDVTTGDGLLRLLVIQLPGRRAVPADAWARGEEVVGRVLGGRG